MKKRTLRIIISVMIVTICLCLVGLYCYDKYYRIDTSQFHYTFLSRIVESPDGKHQVFITVYKDSENSEVAYIKGNLNLVSSQKDAPKTIFWQKVNSSDIDNRLINDMLLDNWVDVEWINNDTVKINNITVNIHKDIYDYRRAW